MDRRDRHSGDLPWGWWLRARELGLEDDSGRTWRTVREAFWVGQLGFPAIHLAGEQQELMTRVLTAIDARWLAGAEHKHDLFAGDMMFSRFYLCWLASIGMLDPAAKARTLDAPLSPEGKSVMLMMQATREPDWEDLPMTEVVNAVASAKRGEADAARERALTVFERSVAHRRHVFARERVGRSHLITLTGIATDARMPTRRVAWSQSFAEDQHRDDLFAWIAERVDRWDDWWDLAYRQGGDALTQRLLMLVVQTGGLAS